MVFKKSQVAIEFIVLLLISVAIFGTISYLIVGKYTENQDETRKESLDDLARYLQSEIYTASTMIPDFERTLDLPIHIGKYPYKISILNNYLYAEQKDFQFIYPLPKTADSPTIETTMTIKVTASGVIVT